MAGGQVAAKPLTVIQLLPTLESGGVERGTIEIADVLATAGHRSIVISGGGKMVSELARSNTEHITLPIGAKRISALRLIKPLRQLFAGADIVHPRSRVPAWLTWLALKKMDSVSKPQLVTTVHGFYSVNRYSAIMTKGERVIAVSNAINHYIRQHYPATPNERIRVIPRGIDRNAFPFGFTPCPEWLTEWRAQMPDIKQHKIIMLIGRLTRLKGHEQFIELIRQLNAAGQAVHGVIVGGEDPRRLAYAKSLYERAANLPVSFLGQRSDVRELMSVADLVLSLSSKPESFGRTVLEALALGRPVAGFEHGGVGEILSALYPHGKVATANDTDMLRTVTELLSAPIAVAPSDAFTLACMQKETLAVYEQLAGAR